MYMTNERIVIGILTPAKWLQGDWVRENVFVDGVTLRKNDF